MPSRCGFTEENSGWKRPVPRRDRNIPCPTSHGTAPPRPPNTWSVRRRPNPASDRLRMITGAAPGLSGSGWTCVPKRATRETYWYSEGIATGRGSRGGSLAHPTPGPNALRPGRQVTRRIPPEARSAVADGPYGNTIGPAPRFPPAAKAAPAPIGEVGEYPSRERDNRSVRHGK